jgi:hypothetical protein
MPKARAPFVFDEEAIELARLRLGLRLPVRARIAYSQNVETHGRYMGQRGGVHHIAISSEHTPLTASRCLWHALGHALQAERLGSGSAFAKEWDRQLSEAGIDPNEPMKWHKRRAYKRMPLEREAEDLVRRRNMQLCQERPPERP